MNGTALLQQLAHFAEANVDSFAAAGFGAFLGSGSAFLLESKRRKRELRDKEHDAALTAQYALQAQWSTLESIRLQLLERWRGDSDRHLKLTAFSIPDARLAIPFDRLIFIAKRDDPDLLQEIRIAEESYNGAMDSLRGRNEKLEAFYYDPEVRKESFDAQTGKGTGPAPAYKVFLIKQLTDGLYQSVTPP